MYKRQSYVIPVVATALGALFLGEQITLIMLVGMAIIFAGITLLNWRRRVQVKGGMAEAVKANAG